jgi:hypothetical protein
MTPFEIRLELLKLARDILQARSNKPEDMPSSSEIILEAERLNQFVSNKAV